MSSKFIHTYETADHRILDLLDSIAYGSNGAIYRHQDTKDRIQMLDDPLFLTLERNDQVIANLTFCRRQVGWYIRFFGFSERFRSTGKTKKNLKNSTLKNELKQFFDQAFINDLNGLTTSKMYAYIDAENDRSELISKEFGFSIIGQLITQTFSRVHPKRSKRLRTNQAWELVREQVLKQYGEYRFLHLDQISKGNFYTIVNDDNEIIGLCHAIKVHWTIDRLPGKYGKILTKLIPYIPVIRKLIKPKNHHFLAVDTVWTKQNDPVLIEELFSSILVEENLNLLIWWSDVKDPIRGNLGEKIYWGLLDKMVGRTVVNVISRQNEIEEAENSKPVFVSVFDMV
jgi:hypothetical protein